MLRDSDISRLAEHCELDAEDFLLRYALFRNGKWSVKSEGGACVFFAPPGCGVHPARPDICRAWPFFRGNLVDATSLEMAREYCPGINPDRSFEEFAMAGKAYLAANKLACRTGDGNVPSALCCDDGNEDA